MKKTEKNKAPTFQVVLKRGENTVKRTRKCLKQESAFSLVDFENIRNGMSSMINVAYAKRLLFDTLISVLRLSRLNLSYVPMLSLNLNFCLSFDFISNKPAWFMVMQDRKNALKWPWHIHTSRTNQKYMCI